MSHPLLTLFKTALITTDKGTFYNTDAEQLKMLAEQHSAALIYDRNLYTAIAFTNINGFNKLVVLRGLLATGKSRNPDQEELEWEAIVEIVKSLSITYVLRFFLEITQDNKKTGAKRLNNSRVNRLGTYLWLSASPFRVIKYAKKYNQIISRCHIPPTLEGSNLAKQELHQWLKGRIKNAEEVHYCQELKSLFEAKAGDREALKRLPLDVAQGIATGKLGMSVEEFRSAIANESSGTSTTEKMRLQAQTDGQSEIDWRKYDLLQLVRYGRDHQDQWHEIFPVIQAKAAEISRKITLPPNVGVIVDNSLSMIGSSGRKGYPIAFAEAVMRILLSGANPINVWLTNDINYDINRPLMAKGASDLRIPVAKAISAGCKEILIISDGYENQTEGSVNQIAKLKVVKQAGIRFHHINAVAASEVGTARTLGETILPLTISGLEQLSVAGMLKIFESSPSSFEGFLRDIFSAIEAKQFDRAFEIATFRNQPVKLLGEI